MFEVLSFPSLRHEKYLLQAVRLCLDEGIFLAVEGSILQRTATEFSDLNLIGVGDIDRRVLEKLVNVYGRPIMTWIAPTGFYHTVYEDALAVRWDLRPAFFRDEMLRILIVAGEGHYTLSETPMDKTKLRSLLFPTRNVSYQILCMTYQAIEKYLGGRAGVAREMLAEVLTSLKRLGWEKIPSYGIRHIAAELLEKLGNAAMADPAFLELFASRIRLIPED